MPAGKKSVMIFPIARHGHSALFVISSHAQPVSSPRTYCDGAGFLICPDITLFLLFLIHVGCNHSCPV